MRTYCPQKGPFGTSEAWKPPCTLSQAEHFLQFIAYKKGGSREDMIEKVCRKCLATFPRTSEYFYTYAPKKDHPNGGFQPYCKICWKNINAANKLKLKAKKVERRGSDRPFMKEPIWKTGKSEEQMVS